MNRKLLWGAAAGVAAIALTVGGTTYSAFSDFGDINGNSVGAGILKLDLTSGNGGDAAPLSFGDLYPGGQSKEAIYVASSDSKSVPPADLYLTIQGVQSKEDGCSSSKSEVAADSDCNDTSKPGELDQVLDVRVSSYAAPSALACKGWVGGTGDPGPLLHDNVLPTNEQGTLADSRNLNKQFLISDANHPLTAGQGVCVTFVSWWPANHEGGTPDNAAQGDSVTFNNHFDLLQHITQ